MHLDRIFQGPRAKGYLGNVLLVAEPPEAIRVQDRTPL